MYLSKNHDHFDIWVFLISHHVIHERCTWISVTANGHALVHTICGPRDDIVEFIGHAARTRHVGNAAEKTNLITLPGGPFQNNRQVVSNLIHIFFSAVQNKVWR